MHVSRLSVVNLPASEILNEDPENVRIQQGPTLNKAIFSLNSLFRDLSATPHGDYANYDDSMLTSLARDVFGGNSLCLGVFSLAHGDTAGSLQTLRAMRRCQMIQNFPIENNGRTVGLFGKMRSQI